MKRKYNYILIGVLLLILSLGFFFRPISNKEQEKISTLWAQAYCSRDAETLRSLWNPEKEEDFYSMSFVSGSGDELLFGMSSPWPDSEYELNILQNNQVKIVYQVTTSTPSGIDHTQWIETITLSRYWGRVYVAGEQLHCMTAEEME